MRPRSPITTHVLDTHRGRPAAGIAVTLEREVAGRWVEIGRGTTDSDGRCEGLLAPDRTVEPGEYRLGFETGAWFAAAEIAAFHPRVVVAFVVAPGDLHYHVPLLLGAHGYTTYRGS